MNEEIKISQLQEANEINENDLMMIIQNGVNKKKNIKQMAKELGEVAINPTQPTTNEKVWFKKGKNLLNKNNYFVDELGYVGFVVNLEYGQTYTLSSNLPIIAKFAKKSNLAGPTVGPQNWIKFTSWTFVAGQNTGNYLNNVVFIGINEKEMQKNVEAYSNYNIQIEQGSTATEYEAYIEPAIYTKNDNGVYEEIISNKAEKYSANELAVGTWINGKTIYRKCLSLTSPSTANTNTNIYTITENIDTLIDIKGNVYNKGASYKGLINSYITADDNISTWGFCDTSGKITNIRCRASGTRTNSPMTVIIEYTKN